MSYSLVALMEDIANRNSDQDDGVPIQLPFPSLPQPPTDSEATAATSSSAASTAATTMSDQASALDVERCLRRRGDGDGSGANDLLGESAAMASSSKRKRSLNDDDDEEEEGAAGESGKRHRRPMAMATSSSVSKPTLSLKSPPETNLPPPGRRQHEKRSSFSRGGERPPSPDDRTEIEIDELDFDGGHERDPADRIRTALHKYVVLVKRRETRLEEERRNEKCVAAGGPAASSASVHSAPRKNGNESITADAAAGGVTEGRGRQPQLTQRPIQVIMSWMDTFQDHEKIQLVCLQSLPTILGSPSSRVTAQADGLASIVLYDMAAFPANSLLQLTAFHTLVVLLRPLGTNEGAVHRMRDSSPPRTTAAGNGSGSHATNKSAGVVRSIRRERHGRGGVDPVRDDPGDPNGRGRQQRPLLDAIHEPSWTENGVRVMLDSLRRFSSDRYLQAMGCWAMVNAALYPTLKRSLLRLGGVYAVTNAMMLHPNVEAVQFRGLFALINLVIPDNKSKKEYGAPNDGSSIHSHIYQIARLTIVAMKNFHANKSILNRGCLVLRNLSLTPAFVKILARTPGCVDMLLHCRQVCGPRDALVQRSARTIMILVQRAVAGETEGSAEGGGDGSALSIAFGQRPKF